MIPWSNPCTWAMDHEYSLPSAERLEASIAQGIELGKKERRRRKRRTLQRLGASIAACVLILSCAFTIRLSPAFAAFMRDIPGMETFVNLVRDSGDRSLGFALDNDFVQPLQITDEYGGVKLTVDGVIADDGRAVIFYTIDNRYNDKVVTISSPKIKEFARERGCMQS